MSVMPDNAVIAVDGGGTRCRLVLDAPGACQMVEVGSANVTTDFDAATTEILQGLHRLAAQAGASVDDLRTLPAYFGLAGVTCEAIADRVARSMPFARVLVEDDRRAALRGALGATDGAIAHCGTGSFLALQAGGVTHLAGGWGAVLGDESSAMWVGRQALSETLRAEDGLAERSALVEDIHRQLGSSADIVAFAAAAKPAEFGRFAMDVTRNAAQDDPVARSILQKAADIISIALPQLGWEAGMALCLTGGIGPVYGEFLPWTLRDALVSAQDAPIGGAIALAQEFAKELHNENC